ncbi:hypothetical protein GCM10010446_14300 [Streptomyces enissocaesilis]|uniref:Uncharacterized protein n=1 Tax=Streptomyces enissocaesilis TaxID=332589 RepID=A0ABP6JGZ2_9ACTN
MPQDVAKERGNAYQLIDCPVLTLWDEGSGAAGQTHDVLDVWKHPPRCPQRAHRPVRAPVPGGNAPTSSTGTSSAFSWTGTAEQGTALELGEKLQRVDRSKAAPPVPPDNVGTHRTQPGRGQTNTPLGTP